MFALDIITLKLLSQLYEEIYLWPDSAFYGFGEYSKFIISVFVFQQCYNIVCAYKKKKAGDNK